MKIKWITVSGVRRLVISLVLTAAHLPSSVFGFPTHAQQFPRQTNGDLSLDDIPTMGIVPAIMETARRYALMDAALQAKIREFQENYAEIVGEFLQENQKSIPATKYSGSRSKSRKPPPSKTRSKRQTGVGAGQTTSLLSQNGNAYGNLGLALPLNYLVNSGLSTAIRLSNLANDFGSALGQLTLGSLFGVGSNLDGGRVTNANANNGLG